MTLLIVIVLLDHLFSFGFHILTSSSVENGAERLFIQKYIRTKVGGQVFN